MKLFLKTFLVFSTLFSLILLENSATLGGSFGGKSSSSSYTTRSSSSYSKPSSSKSSSWSSSKSSSGTSFGGSRSSSSSYSSSRPSFGGKRSYPTYQKPSSSFGSFRSKSTSSTSIPKPEVTQKTYTSNKNNFSGVSTWNLKQRNNYLLKYGVPRKSETKKIYSSNGTSQNIIVHNYGGVSDGFTTGYLTGQASWYWSTPFHPAFYYSTPSVHKNSNGVTEVYPAEFSVLYLILGLILLSFVLVLILGFGYYWVKRSRNKKLESSFS